MSEVSVTAEWRDIARSKRRRQSFEGLPYLLLAPIAILLVLVIVYPLVEAVRSAMTDASFAQLGTRPLQRFSELHQAGQRPDLPSRRAALPERGKSLVWLVVPLPPRCTWEVSPWRTFTPSSAPTLRAEWLAPARPRSGGSEAAGRWSYCPNRPRGSVCRLFCRPRWSRAPESSEPSSRGG